MSSKEYKIIDLAENQLKTSILLFLSGRDLISSITLAGAADTLLCSIVRSRGLNSFTQHILASENNPEKTLQDMGREINDIFKINALKHMNDINDDSVTLNLRECAIGAIIKTLPNFKEIKGLDHDYIQAFLIWIRKNLDPNIYNIYCDPNWKIK